MSELLARFTDGPDGRRRLVDQLLRQPAAGHDRDAARLLAEAAVVYEVEPGQTVIRQDARDTDIHFIVFGEVAIEVSGRELTFRSAGQHVGEMAMIDPSQPRSATVRARTASVLARVSEPSFEQLAQDRPLLWRAIAVELGSRLRQRNGHVRRRNETPVVFVGSCSSAEGLGIARALQAAFAHDSWITRIWTDSVFAAGMTPIESLAGQVQEIDFALLVVTPDDLVSVGEATRPSPRDNVIFELGLAIGALGRERALMVKTRCKPEDLRLPSDLMGVQPLEVVPGDPATIASRVGPAANEFRRLVLRLGSR